MRKRRIRLNHDPTTLQPLHDIRVVQPWMQFVLSDADLAAPAGLDVLLQLFKVVDSVVRYPDGLDFAGLLGFDECVP